MCWWAVNNIISFDFIERPYEIKGEFAATAGVATNSEVAYLGVNYGDVSGVESVDGKVMITMSIDRGKEIPAGSVARIFRKSAIGEPYIDFNPPADFAEGGTDDPTGRRRPPRTDAGTARVLRAAAVRLPGPRSRSIPARPRRWSTSWPWRSTGGATRCRDLTVSSDALLADVRRPGRPARFAQRQQHPPHPDGHRAAGLVVGGHQRPRRRRRDAPGDRTRHEGAARPGHRAARADGRPGRRRQGRPRLRALRPRRRHRPHHHRRQPRQPARSRSTTPPRRSVTCS